MGSNIDARSHSLNHLHLLTFWLLTLLLSGCSIFFPAGRPSDPVAALRYDIDRILSDSIFTPARASVKIVSLDSKEVLFERDSKMLMRPASNMKLLTSATALHVLGTDYQFRTSVLADITPNEGVIAGNLYLKGYGNPDLKTSDLDTLVAQVQLTGIKSIQGGVVGDVSFFDDLYWGNGWQWDDEPDSDAPFLTPLAINDNCVQVTVAPGRSPADSVNVGIDPHTRYVSLVNRAKTVGDTVRHQLTVTRLFKERLNTILIDGEMLIGARPVNRKISVWKPELYTTTLFQEALQQRGVTVEKEPSIGLAPPNARQIATHSRNLDSAIINLNKTSDNLTAEMILKTLGAVTSGTPGSAQAGIYAVLQFLTSFGIDTTKFHIADGSGVSSYNLLTAEMIVQLLEGVSHQKAVFPTYYASLPVAGVDGTLGDRMKRTPAEGNLRAKTGTISGVSSLSGFVHTLDGEMLAFSMSMQNFIYPTRLYRAAQDSIGALLAGFSRIGRTPQQP